MNVTKNALTKALNCLNEYPKSSLKKDDLIDIYNEIFNEKNINNFIKIINYNIYKILSQLEQAESGIYIDNKYRKDVDFLKNILIIEKEDNKEEKIYIEFTNGMKDNFAKFINSKNEDKIKNNQKIVNLIINIIEVYGLMQVDYELSNMLNDLLVDEIDVDYLIELVDYNIDIRRKTVIPNCETDLFIMNNNIYNPQDIFDERRKRNLEYKKYTIEELKNKNLESLMKCDEAQKVIKFLKDINYEMPETLVKAFIVNIMSSVQINVKDFMNVQNLNIDNIDEANEYLQLIMNLHNNIPHYVLCGYSPNELMKMQLEEIKKEEENNKNNKISRNDLCPCR